MRKIVVLLLTLAPVGAWADQPSAREQARTAFVRGQTLYRQGKFNHALAAFSEAAKHATLPSITINMAQCHRNLGNHQKAVFFYRLYLSQWRRQYPNRPVAHEAEIKEHIRKLQATIRRLEQRRPKASPAGHIRVVGVGVSRAQVLVDDAPRAVTPMARPIKVLAGEHEVRVEAEGYQTWRGKVTVEAGKAALVRVVLRPIPRLRRRTGWLLATLGALTLAAAAEAVAIAYNVEANRQFVHTESYHNARDVSVAGHVAAGTLAAAASACLYFYLTSGREEPLRTTAAALVPLPGGAAASLEVRF